MNGTVERLDAGAFGVTRIHEGELLRHPASTRLIHWGSAAFFILALLSGFAVYSPWLFHWLTPLFGGGAMTRLLHPWFSLGFVVIFALQILNWRHAMRWTDADPQWIRHAKDYIANRQPFVPDYVDFFNAGQKIYFWAIAASALIFIVSGLPMWFPDTFGRAIVPLAYVLHDVAALVMLVGFIIHFYEGTAASPGTFRSMTRGTVDNHWAWIHHPAWYRRATGQNPRAQ
jgi:formate dehydrogenase subunit gamma